MYIFKTVHDLQQYLNLQQKQAKKIGFVPTMGALHLGHLTLVQKALQQHDIVVCSIFVNPTQFGDAQDLDKYPRPIQNDIQKLEQLGCSVLFLPTVEEVYPKGLKTPDFDLGGLDQTMEGAHRPGHFKGVVQVVHRLLDIVQPHSLFMGQKDYQQFAIIKRMLELMNSFIQLVRVPIVREKDGLAMSSRNVRLSETGRKKACLISKLLFQAKEDAKDKPLAEVRENALAFIALHEMDVDYFTIIDGDSLNTIQSFDQATTITACTTVRIDGVRLLDNIILREKI
ncbi:pantoate--beta-alanine ligase [Aureispira anguillae]|uniref:Pantothenate synthetase n=1 Tax=Aureispira anguillae TaxID=2864201 RepID=A0A915YL14_9BACT|nr:pantoate--beta-alanine ligase [Aureispira anguillae]BDS15163.1 pantoate--beta-alanine ligase [Aureispira anguillae]